MGAGVAAGWLAAAGGTGMNAEIKLSEIAKQAICLSFCKSANVTCPTTEPQPTSFFDEQTNVPRALLCFFRWPEYNAAGRRLVQVPTSGGRRPTKVVEQHDVADLLSVLKQIGALP